MFHYKRTDYGNLLDKLTVKYKVTRNMTNKIVK